MLPPLHGTPPSTEVESPRSTRAGYPLRAGIELRSLRKCFGAAVAVDDVTLSIPAGSVFGLLGPNGAGKTTTIRMIMDIVPPDAGDVTIFGEPPSPERMAGVGYLPEERGLYKKMRVLDHLVFLGELRGLTPADARRAGQHWLERVGLADRGAGRVEELSKGMQQKVQLAGTLMHEPELLILDEPFSGLDPINQGLFRDVLAEVRAAGRTILLSTHIMEHAEKLCDAIGLISHGRVVLTGPLEALKQRFGGHRFQLRARGELDRIASMSAVVRSTVLPDGADLSLKADADPAEVLRELVGFLDVAEFRSQAPDLEEIFVQAVGDA